MKVILREDIPDLGTIGELVTVADGYARNYLLPKKLAVQASLKNANLFEHQKRTIERHKERVRQDAGSLAEHLSSVSCTIPVLVGEQDKLFGSVTARDIEEALAQEGVKISRKKILLEEPIRQLGVYTVDVHLHPEVTGKLKVWVVAK
ncbi:MAG: 50S ribosomal protein L9 [Deltaproteobacteria bacterium]|nr:50S ribosomal protein L9 [Deltaproteobacteria bacterium]